MLVALAVLVALAAGTRAVLPWAIERAVEWQAPSRLGIPVHLGNVDLWLLRGAVAVEDLVVGAGSEGPAEPAPGRELLRLRRLYVHIDWTDLFRRRVHLRELALDAPAIRVERDAQGRIVVPVPPAPAEPAPPAAEPAQPSPPWTFALDRFDLRELALVLADLASGNTPAEFALARLSLSDVSVAGSALGLGGIEIESPVLRIDRDFAFAGAPGPGAGEEPEAASPDAGEPLAYEIERVDIANAGFTLRTGAGPIDLRVRLEAEKVSARSGELFPVSLELGIGDGKLSLVGKLGLNPLAFDGRLAYSNLALPPLSVAARPELAAWVRSCRAEGDFAVELRSERAADREAGLRIAGTATVSELRIADPSGEEVSIGWKQLEIVAREVFVPLAAEGEPARATRVALERVRLVEPDLRYTLPAPSLAALLGAGDAEAEGEAEPAAQAPEAEAAPAGGAAPEGAPVEVGVDVLEIVGGRLGFRDSTVSPRFETEIRDLSLAAAELRFPEPRARRLRSRGIIPATGSFTFEGDLDGESGQLRFELARLALPAFDPYATGAGYRLAQGELSLTSAVRLRGARAGTTNRLVLHQLDVSSTSPGGFERNFGIPLDLALALLRDPAGDISFEIPVAFDEGGVRVEIATIVAGALRQALVGALSSPLKLVGAVLPTGGGEPALAPLEALPGRAALAPGSGPRLEALAKLLASRPVLALRLRGRAGPGDWPLLAEQILVEQAVAGAEWPEIEDAGFLARRRLVQALAARGRGEGAELSPEDAALLARYVAAVEVDPERMRQLAQLRSEAVRDELVSAHGVDASRLSLGEAPAPGESAVVLELGASPPDGSAAAPGAG